MNRHYHSEGRVQVIKSTFPPTYYLKNRSHDKTSVANNPRGGWWTVSQPQVKHSQNQPEWLEVELEQERLVMRLLPRTHLLTRQLAVKYQLLYHHPCPPTTQEYLPSPSFPETSCCPLGPGSNVLLLSRTLLDKTGLSGSQLLELLSSTAQVPPCCQCPAGPC